MELLPTWYKDINSDDYYLVLTNDMDSYFSCRILQKIIGIDIGGFYSFENGLYLNLERAFEREPIYVDLSVTQGKALDNHYSFITNPETINPNVIKKPYFKKYCGGTLALTATLFDDVSNYNENQIMALLAIDGFYIGYYNNDGKYRDINLYWFDMLGITEYVLPILINRDANDFLTFKQEQKLDRRIYVNDDGMLESNINMTLPPGKFELVQPIQKLFMPKWEAVVLYQKQRDRIMVSNEIFSGKYVINLKE